MPKKKAAKPAARKSKKPASQAKAVTPTPTSPGESAPITVLAKPEVKKIQGLLKSKTTDGVTLGLSLLESLVAAKTDYMVVFSEPVIRAIVDMWEAEALLATAKHLLPQLDLCKRFIAVAADKFCRATEPERVRLLHDLLHQPFCSGDEELELDMSDGTILWDVFHRELLASGRITMAYHEDESDLLRVCIVHSLNGIHIAGFDQGRGEGRPCNIPCHVLQASKHGFLHSHGWFEVAWAVSRDNMVEQVMRRTSDCWTAYDWAWDNGEHLVVAMLWSTFSVKCRGAKSTAETGVKKNPTLFRWTEKGSRSLVAYAGRLVQNRTFMTPGLGDLVYLPWQYPESFQNDFEVRCRKGHKAYASYASLHGDFKRLAYEAAVAVRDAANHISPNSNGLNVIAGLANHTLICLALHPATPETIVRSLAADKDLHVTSAATAGRAANGDRRSPTEKMKEIVDCVVRCTGGRALSDKVSDDTLAIAKRLSRCWSRWKQRESLDEVDAVNTEDPCTNENRMRAVAMGVALARGWIVPTKEGISLMRNSVVELDAFPAATSNDADEDDD